MLRFISRRLLTAIGVLFAATYLFFILAANAGDPLEDLRASTQPNRDYLIEQRTEQLHLDVNPFIRYFYWLADAVKGDLGNDYKTGQPVTTMVGDAMGQTIKLVGFASVAAIVLGVLVGIISALRQYSGFDYGITLMTFLMYSLPSFWVAVLLKQWGAIGFNDFLADPVISPGALILIGLVMGVIVGAALGGEWKRRLMFGGIAAVMTAGILGIMSATGWFTDPGLGPVVILFLGLGVAYIAVFLVTGLNNRRALYTALTVVVLGVIAWFPMAADQLNGAFAYTGFWAAIGFFFGFVALGIVVGLLFKGPDKWISARVGGIVGGFMYVFIWLDYLMSWWEKYSNTSAINGRPIATVGSSTPELAGSGYWIGTIDTFTHMVLPISALILISFAGYTRYMRGSMLEVMNLDYIRTARAKGMPERTVVMRHGFRNALIPIATIIPLDLAALFGGAIITETVFGWNGMGRLFVDALNTVNVNVLMGYFLVTGILLLIGNIIADVLYVVLDPRIRVES
ncbi:ABC transporter permease [Demequina sp.]|uniref:ABC transporter permease n=1 Tax=Demequina sp. TaxID=2050685 RepID=UPI003D09D73E